MKTAVNREDYACKLEACVKSRGAAFLAASSIEFRRTLETAKRAASAVIAVPLILFMQNTSMAEDAPAKPYSHTERQIEGWTVRIDDRLLQAEDAETGERALKLLTARLVPITLVVREPALEHLRKIPIQIDMTHGGLKQAQYHPSADWLKAKGYSERLARCVHIPDAKLFLSPYECHRQPWMILHELAHGYHDQVLGFEDRRIEASYEKFKESGRYKTVLTINGDRWEHYALTNAKEFFAEMTECYFGTNDFYPFVAGELQRDEPEIYALLQEIWGPLPNR